MVRMNISAISIPTSSANTCVSACKPFRVVTRLGSTAQGVHYVLSLNVKSNIGVSMTKLVTFVVLVCSFSAFGASKALTLSPENLTASCYDHRVYAFNNGAEIYQSSYYFSILGCPEDAHQLQVKIRAARIFNQKITMTPAWSPSSAFTIVGDTVIDPNKVSLTCEGHGFYNVDQKLTATLSDGRIIYQSTRYVGNSGCSGAFDEVARTRNAAKAAGKLLKINFTNSPGSDFEITDNDQKQGN